MSKAVDASSPSNLQNRINAMVGIGTKAFKEWTGALADQGKELERLRAKRIHTWHEDKVGQPIATPSSGRLTAPSAAH